MIAIGQPPAAFIHPVTVNPFSGDSPNPSAWTDLDLSSYIGVRASLVFLQVLNVEVVAAQAGYAFREKYIPVDREAKAANFPNDCGGTNCFNVASVTNDSQGYFLIQTDGNGVLQWYCDKADHETIINILCYIPIRG